MLKEDIILAVKAGEFNIIAVDNVCDAMEVLTKVGWNDGQRGLEARCMLTLKHFNRLRNVQQHSVEDLRPVPAKKKSGVILHETPASVYLEKP
jgi:hypothetical protein